MSLPTPVFGTAISPVVVASTLFVSFSLALLVYLDAKRRRANRYSLAPLAWGATTFFAGLGGPLVALCYAIVQLR
ncbi:hypothetical protein [Halorussus halophilus]|uniref:hypothetical protein n=1 Tax=Halorussus halophilus TaxID=2650975 RepID=UPI0013019386|nr:hypothetical protein [Halorussus halophilus]